MRFELPVCIVATCFFKIGLPTEPGHAALGMLLNASAYHVDRSLSSE